MKYWLNSNFLQDYKNKIIILLLTITLLCRSHMPVYLLNKRLEGQVSSKDVPSIHLTNLFGNLGCPHRPSSSGHTKCLQVFEAMEDFKIYFMHYEYCWTLWVFFCLNFVEYFKKEFRSGYKQYTNLVLQNLALSLNFLKYV